MLKRINLWLVFLPVILVSLSLITLFSTSSHLVQQQVVFFVLGILSYALFTVLDRNYLRYYWKYIYGVCALLLLLTFILGATVFGSARWLSVGFLTFQPSELAKLVVVITMAAYYCLQAKNDLNLKHSLILFGLIGVLCALVLLQPDLGTTVIIGFASFVILLATNFNKYYLALLILVIGMFSAPVWNSLHDYQQKRVLVFFNPQSDTLGSGYNVIQSMIAVGSGGVTGRGFGQGTQAKLNFLPVHWTDFIFAAYAEEFGFVGCLVLIGLYAMLLINLALSLPKAKNTYEYLFVLGITAVFFIQVVVNIGMNLGLMPVTGIPLPLFSYGGTSMLVSMSMLGMVQNILLY